MEEWNVLSLAEHLELCFLFLDSTWYICLLYKRQSDNPSFESSRLQTSLVYNNPTMNHQKVHFLIVIPAINAAMWEEKEKWKKYYSIREALTSIKSLRILVKKNANCCTWTKGVINWCYDRESLNLKN